MGQQQQDTAQVIGETVVRGLTILKTYWAVWLLLTLATGAIGSGIGFFIGEGGARARAEIREAEVDKRLAGHDADIHVDRIAVAAHTAQVVGEVTSLRREVATLTGTVNTLAGTVQTLVGVLLQKQTP
jgi:hypothetical protein